MSEKGNRTKREKGASTIPSLDITEHERAGEALRKAHDELEMRVEERTAELTKANEELRIEMTARKQMEEALKDSGERYRSLVNNIKLGILRSTPGPPGRILEVNPAMEEITGYSRGELLEMDISKVYVDIKERKAILEELASTRGKVARELRWEKKDGAEMVVLDTLVGVRDDTGKVVYFDAIIEDITERKQAEEALRKAHDELEMRVEERTAELTKANEELRIEMTARKQMEEALKDSGERYRSLVNNVKLGILRSTPGPPGRILEVNPAMEEIAGYSREELLEMDISKMYVDIKERKALLEELALTREKVARELRWRKKDGTEMVVLDTLVGVRDDTGKVVYFDAIIEDITERKRAEQLYRTLATSSPVGIYIAQEGNFVFVNPQFQKYMGFAEDELLGRDSLSLVHPEDREMIREKAVAMLKGKRSSPYEFRVINKGGETRWSIETVTSIHYKGERAALGNFMDITERKQTQAKLEQKTIELEQANIRLQEMDRLKSIFLASMSHELRTPLNSIIGFTDLILEGMVGEINEEQRSQLTLVKCSADHLLSLINDVLDISKIEAGKVELSLEEFRLDDVIGGVVESFSPIANLKSIGVVEEVPKGITLFSDRRRVKQVLMNLVSNAVKFTEQGGVKIVARVLRDDILEVSVIDTGTGIRKEDMNRLFVPFQQVDESLTKKHEGTGLGLHLTQKLVTLLGGNISVKSEYGKGSEFTFTIPLQYVEVQRNEKSASSRGQ